MSFIGILSLLLQTGMHKWCCQKVKTRRSCLTLYLRHLHRRKCQFWMLLNAHTWVLTAVSNVMLMPSTIWNFSSVSFHIRDRLPLVCLPFLTLGSWILSSPFLLGIIVGVGGWSFLNNHKEGWSELCCHRKGRNTQILLACRMLWTCPQHRLVTVVSLTVLLTRQGRTDRARPHGFLCNSNIEARNWHCRSFLSLVPILSPTVYNWNKERGAGCRKSNKQEKGLKSQRRTAKHERYKILQCLYFRCLFCKYIRKIYKRMRKIM